MTKNFIGDETKFDVGIFFKEIRQTRGYTQKDAGGNYISKSQLSRFENGDTILTAEKLYYNILLNSFDIFFKFFINSQA